jgi:hypothetical protein
MSVDVAVAIVRHPVDDVSQKVKDIVALYTMLPEVCVHHWLD